MRVGTVGEWLAISRGEVEKVLAFLKGKRTYLVVVVMIVVAVLKALGVIDPPAYEAVMGLLAALGFGALRAGVERAAGEIQGAVKKL